MRVLLGRPAAGSPCHQPHTHPARCGPLERDDGAAKVRSSREKKAGGQANAGRELPPDTGQHRGLSSYVVLPTVMPMDKKQVIGLCGFYLAVLLRAPSCLQLIHIQPKARAAGECAGSAKVRSAQGEEGGRGKLTRQSHRKALLLVPCTVRWCSGGLGLSCLSESSPPLPRHHAVIDAHNAE